MNVCFWRTNQALTDHAKISDDCRIDWECCLGLFSPVSWIQVSQLSLFKPDSELAELSMYYMNLVSLARLERNPTVKKTELLKRVGESIPTGFWFIRLRKQPDITAFKANYVPVGTDQKPMIEQTREIVRPLFNHAYNWLRLGGAGRCLSRKYREQGVLPGLDGNAKMSKSLNNGIYLADDADTLRKSHEHILIGSYSVEDPE